MLAFDLSIPTDVAIAGSLLTERDLKVLETV